LRQLRTNGGPVLLSSLVLLLVGCVSSPIVTQKQPHYASVVIDDTPIDEEVSQLLATMRHDLTLSKQRDRELLAYSTPSSTTPRSGQQEMAERFSPQVARPGSRSIALVKMPVVGVRSTDLRDSWGAPRDGGRRKHRGIDIFAPKGTPIVAVTDGTITYIGEQPKGGLCVWLSTEWGYSFYYAHLDRWAPGIYEGMEVRAGDLLGYVGNTGNARSTPPHLHFGIHMNSEAVNPYPVLKQGRITTPGNPLYGGFGTTAR
jgi:peptidoglycan LD-endopeptidase LytH